ncbi:MAG: hypothetical protein SOR74_03800 [Candidatus Faecivicinus sp.]|nr:hypothetical protein [Candidatus Faecivicinus sp.]
MAMIFFMNIHLISLFLGTTKQGICLKKMQIPSITEQVKQAAQRTPPDLPSAVNIQINPKASPLR